ncbi:MAG: cyclic nucleotide-binding domain-containing protein [Burkholderiaceae bacterium]
MVAVEDSSNPIDIVLQQGARRSRGIQRETHAAVRDLSSALATGYGPKKIPEEHLPKVVNPEPAPEAEMKLEPVPMPKPASAPKTAPASKPVAQSSPAPTTALTPKRSLLATAKAALSPPPVEKPAAEVPAPEASAESETKGTVSVASGMNPEALGPNEVFFAKDQVLFEKGDKADFFYVLVSGKVALFEPSNQSFIANLEPGSSFGEQAILVGGVRSLSARAAEPTVCKAISAQTLGKMLDQEKGTIKPVVYALLLELYMSNDLKSQGLK